MPLARYKIDFDFLVCFLKTGRQPSLVLEGLPDDAIIRDIVPVRERWSSSGGDDKSGFYLVVESATFPEVPEAAFLPEREICIRLWPTENKKHRAYYVECCNLDCGWTGLLTDCVNGSSCPACGTVAQRPQTGSQPPTGAVYVYDPVGYNRFVIGEVEK